MYIRAKSNNSNCLIIHGIQNVLDDEHDKLDILTNENVFFTKALISESDKVELKNLPIHDFFYVWITLLSKTFTIYFPYHMWCVQNHEMTISCDRYTCTE